MFRDDCHVLEAGCQTDIEVLLCAKDYNGYREQRATCSLNTSSEQGTTHLGEQWLVFCMRT